MPYVEAIVPTIVLGLIFWYAIKAISNADRNERKAQAEAEAKITQHGNSESNTSGN
ncbi:hypothetical protein [Glutamicibacter arilaitensis]|uniref:hypothetical protein n=1 Tax=Glutamicibacter arilaitensis TaxID=256701 RepID=UPI00385172D7